MDPAAHGVYTFQSSNVHVITGWLPRTLKVDQDFHWRWRYACAPVQEVKESARKEYWPKTTPPAISSNYKPATVSKHGPVGHLILRHAWKPSKHQTLTRCCFDVGLTSKAVGQYQNNIGSMYRVCCVCNKIAVRWANNNTLVQFDGIPAKRLKQCLFKVGPASQTVDEN